MKKFFIIMLTLSALTDIHAQKVTDSEQTKVNEAITKFFDGMASLDINLLKDNTTPDFLLLEDGNVWNLDTLSIKLAPIKTTSFSRINHLNFIETTVKGNTAWVAYNNAAIFTINGKNSNRTWLESAFLVKEGKGWKIQLLHSTRLNRINQ